MQFMWAAIVNKGKQRDAGVQVQHQPGRVQRPCFSSGSGRICGTFALLGVVKLGVKMSISLCLVLHSGYGLAFTEFVQGIFLYEPN